MAYDQHLAARIRMILVSRRGLSEKNMFGGRAFMLKGHMCCGVIGKKLMVRVGPDQYEKALAKAHARKMDFTGKPLRGFLYVSPAGISTARELRRWIVLAEAYVTTLPPK